MDDDTTVVRDLVRVYDNPNESSFTRMISLALRHGARPRLLVEQLAKDKDSDMFSFARCISRILKNYIEEDIEDGQAACRGPILASNFLWLVCQDNKIFKVNAYDGIIKNIFDIDSPSNIAPIVIKENLIFYTEDAEVITYR